ncbi:MAG TPA: tetratricopeptide repeat protein, partial [Deltaproteobacteria bacterium]|nr:tetratricopeptide repeat protein [Deltaproteobacteria bacterium]
MRHCKTVFILVFLFVLTGWMLIEAKEHAPNPAEDPQKTLAFWDEVISLDTENAEAFNKRGTAYKNMGQYQRAIEDYNQAIVLNSQYAEAYYNRGVAHKQLERYQEA